MKRANNLQSIIQSLLYSIFFYFWLKKIETSIIAFIAKRKKIKKNKFCNIDF